MPSCIILSTDEATPTFDRRILQQAEILRELHWSVLIVAFDSNHSKPTFDFRHDTLFLLIQNSFTRKKVDTWAKKKMPRILRHVLRIIKRLIFTHSSELRLKKFILRRRRFLKFIFRLMPLRSYSKNILLQLYLKITDPSKEVLRTNYVWAGEYAPYSYNHAFDYLSAGTGFDLIISCDATTAIPGLILSQQCGALLYFDAHEYYSEQNSLNDKEKIEVKQWEELILQRSHRCYTVNPLIAEIMNKDFDLGNKIDSLPNALKLEYGKTFTEMGLKKRLGIPDSEKLIVYHGWMSPDRNIERLVLLLDHFNVFKVHLVLMGYGDLNQFVDRERPNVYRLSSVPVELLAETLSDVDLICVPYSPIDLNTTLCFPNKVGDAIQLRIPFVFDENLIYLNEISRKFNIGIPVNWQNLPESAEKIEEFFNRDSPGDWTASEMEIGWTGFKSKFEKWILDDFGRS
jgi:hypothetical protein